MYQDIDSDNHNFDRHVCNGAKAMQALFCMNTNLCSLYAQFLPLESHQGTVIFSTTRYVMPSLWVLHLLLTFHFFLGVLVVWRAANLTNYLFLYSSIKWGRGPT